MPALQCLSGQRELRQVLFQGAGPQTAADPSQTVPGVFTAPTQAVLLLVFTCQAGPCTAVYKLQL